MNKTSKKLLLALCVALLVVSVALLAACKEEEDPYQYVQDRGNTVRVLFDSVKAGVTDYRIKPGSPLPEPGVTQGVSKPIAEGFVFLGYYKGTKNADGEVVYGDKWDYSEKVYEDMTLYGKWEIQYRLHINYVMDGEISDQDSYSTVEGNAAEVTSIVQPSWQGNTFVRLYTDEDCTQPLTVSAQQPFEHGCTQEHPVRELYALFISGKWRLVEKASDLRTVAPGDRLYFMNDVDMSELNDGDYTEVTMPTVFGGIIEGNGHTLSNLHYLRENALGTGTSSSCVGLFAQLSNATVRNITFKDCSVQGSIVNNLPQNYYYGFMAGEAIGDCVFENIIFDNCIRKPLQFKSAFDAEKELAKVIENVFVAEGSTYLPEIR